MNYCLVLRTTEIIIPQQELSREALFLVHDGRADFRQRLFFMPFLRR
nr:MAG TPA: hypothetical protein [Caudoviricetes sp.]